MAATKRLVDLTNVKEGGVFKPRRKPEGDYKAKIVKVDDHQPKDKDKSPGWVYTIMVEGDARSTYPYYVNPAPKEAWKIGAIGVAAGFNISGKRVNFDPNKLVGKTIGIALEDDEFEGRLKSTIGDVFPASDVGGRADDDVDLDDDETAIPDDEEVAEEEYEEEPEPTPPPRKRARKPAPPPEPEPEDEEEYEEEEEAPKPVARKRTAKAAPPAKRTRPVARARTAEPEDDDDLDELEIDELD